MKQEWQAPRRTRGEAKLGLREERHDAEVERVMEMSHEEFVRWLEESDGDLLR